MLDSGNRTLTETEQKKSYESINNIINYAGESDCTATGDVTNEMRDQTLEYFDKISDSYFSDAAVGEEPLVKVNDEYNAFMALTTPC